MLKKILKIIVFIATILVALYIYLLSDYNPMFKNDDYVYLTKALDNTKAEDLEPIIALYNKIHENETKGCSCEAVLKLVNSYNYGSLLKKAIYILKIEKEYSEDTCLKLELLNYDFCFRTIGIHNACQFYFHKILEELNEKEKLTIVAMMTNSALFNPIKNKKRVENKILIYRKILHQNKLK